MSARSDRQALFQTPIAHRGLHDHSQGIIENTESAFNAAIAKGFAIECDVQMSKDLQPVVFHDNTLNRLMQATGDINQYSLKELKSMAFLDTADRIQSLSELLEQMNGQVPLIVELKTRWDNNTTLALQIANSIKSYKGLLATMSYDPVLVTTIRRAKSPFANGIVARTFTNKEPWTFMSPFQRFKLRNFLHWPVTRFDFIAYHIQHLPTLPVSLFKKLFRLPVICWTVRNRADIEKAALYCDQITFEGFDPRESSK